jgi:hypothetical protein
MHDSTFVPSLAHAFVSVECHHVAGTNGPQQPEDGRSRVWANGGDPPLVDEETPTLQHTDVAGLRVGAALRHLRRMHVDP